jgi:hypothetical protein
MGSHPEAHEARAPNQRVASVAPLDRNSHADNVFGGDYLSVQYGDPTTQPSPPRPTR